jgi:hypothetical protein
MFRGEENAFHVDLYDPAHHLFWHIKSRPKMSRLRFLNNGRQGTSRLRKRRTFGGAQA